MCEKDVRISQIYVNRIRVIIFNLINCNVEPVSVPRESLAGLECRREQVSIAVKQRQLKKHYVRKKKRNPAVGHYRQAPNTHWHDYMGLLSNSRL